MSELIKIPEISFVVSIYNIEMYLEECIQSLCSINKENIEIILINDGSTDSSPEICQKYAHMDSRIIFKTQSNMGLPASRNAGMNVARGKWITFIDGDDYISENFEKFIISEIDNSVDVISFGYKIFKNGRTSKECAGSSFYYNQADIRNIQLGLLNKYIPEFKKYQNNNILFSATWGKLYKKKWLEEHLLTFSPQAPWGEDVIFSFKVYENLKRMKVITSTGYFYRINVLSMTQKYDANIFEKYISFMSEMKLLVSLKEDAKCYEQFYDMIIKQYLTILRRNIFNPNNPHSLHKRKIDFKETRNNEIVQEGFKKADILGFNFVINIGCILAKHGMFYPLNILYKIQHILEIKKNKI